MTKTTADVSVRKATLPSRWATERAALLQKLGPGLITGASDDDPSGIVTYSQVGAQFGYGAVLNGVLAASLMAVIVHMASSKRVMHHFTLPRYLTITGWLAKAVMFAVAIGVLVPPSPVVLGAVWPAEHLAIFLAGSQSTLVVTIARE